MSSRFITFVALLLLLAGPRLCCGDDAAILAALTGAKNVRPNADGVQMVDGNGQWIRAVKTSDGGYSVFTTNGASRLFRTETGFGYSGPSNLSQRIVVTPRGFAIHGPSGVQELVKVGSAYLDRDSTNNYRIIRTSEGYSTFSGPLAPTPADTTYELFLRRDQQQQPERNLSGLGGGVTNIPRR